MFSPNIGLPKKSKNISLTSNLLLLFLYYSLSYYIKKVDPIPYI